MKTKHNYEKALKLISQGYKTTEAAEKTGIPVKSLYQHRYKNPSKVTVHEPAKKRAYSKRGSKNPTTRMAVVFGSVDEIRELLK